MIPAEKSAANLDTTRGDRMLGVARSPRDTGSREPDGSAEVSIRCMSAPSPTRLVAFHVAARSDDASVRAGVAASEVVHETDPLTALAALGCRELAARNRGTWGLGPVERFAVVLGDDRPELDQLRRACQRHLPEVEVWRVAEGRFVRVEDSVAARPAASPPPRPDEPASEAPPRVVTAEEIRMLLGDRDDDDDDDAPSPPGARR